MTSDNDELKTDQGPAADVMAAPVDEIPPDEGSGISSLPAEAAAAETAGEAEPAHLPRRRGGRGKDKDEPVSADPPENALADVRRELAEFKDRYLRTVAETDNQRKRLEREKGEYFQFALADLMKELLSVLDNFERALQAEPGSDPAGFQEGIGLIHKQMTDLLRKRGVEPIETKDDAFDPSIQQAIVTEASTEVEEPRVTEELQRGYRLHGRLLRPALVKVLIPKKD
ncbi:MAG: nucleotide exchange factor GrpE [Candidatus Aminicenantes bacterium]|nr:nucleotide exchange factor GrpE [Candidatus Aminicenantes bacterium]